MITKEQIAAACEGDRDNAIITAVLTRDYDPPSKAWFSLQKGTIVRVIVYKKVFWGVLLVNNAFVDSFSPTTPRSYWNDN